jgi:multiple sugar transport system substrate-binding protein
MKQGWRAYLVLLALTVLAAGLVFLARGGHQTELRVGIFAGRNWNVPEADAYTVIDAAVQKFEQQHPGTKVTYVSGIPRAEYSEWLAEKIVEGQEPDVFLVLPDDLELYASKGILADLSGLEATEPGFDTADYYPAALAYGHTEAGQSALPVESVPTLMFVNKTLLEREGIPMPKDDWSWDDLTRICCAVTRDTDGDGIIDQFGCYAYTWQQAAVSNGLSLFRADGRASALADHRMEEAVQLLMKLHQLNQGYAVTARDFDMGRVAFRPFNVAEYRAYKPYPWRIKRYTNFEWDCVPMPHGPSGRNASELDSVLMGMSARTSHRRLAWEFLKLMSTDPELQQLILARSQGLPVRRSVMGASAGQEQEGQIDLSMLTQAMDEAVAPPKFARYEEAMLRADRVLQPIIDGNAPFNNALNKLQKDINAYLQY